MSMANTDHSGDGWYGVNRDDRREDEDGTRWVRRHSNEAGALVWMKLDDWLARGVEKPDA